MWRFLASVYSPGWILQSLQPQLASRVERNHHFLFTKDLQSKREMPHTNCVTSWGPTKGDRVLRLTLHSQPASDTCKSTVRSTSLKEFPLNQDIVVLLYIHKITDRKGLPLQKKVFISLSHTGTTESDKISERGWERSRVLVRLCNWMIRMKWWCRWSSYCSHCGSPTITSWTR